MGHLGNVRVDAKPHPSLKVGEGLWGNEEDDTLTCSLPSRIFLSF